MAGSEEIGRRFDRFHSDYDEALERGLSVSGEGKLHFARERIAFLAGCLDEFGQRAMSVLDFGCGTGTATPFFLRELDVQRVVGVDASERSLEVARGAHGSERATFVPAQDFNPEGTFSLAFCNGVFHHVPPQQRAAVARLILESLEPGGLFALWDNNPWNPGARYVMSRIPFDCDAVMISAHGARLLLEREGFEIVRVDHLFVFPRWLRVLRPLERRMTRAPLGAQFQVLARRPTEARSRG